METETLHRSQSRSAPRASWTGWLKARLARHAGLIRWGSAALVLVAVVLLMRTLPAERLLAFAQERIDSLGIWGPLALGLAYVVAVLLFVPGWILTLTAGALYGLVLGTAIASIASTTAAALAFLIARHVARDKVRRRVEQSPQLAAVDEAIGVQGWKIVALLRLSPAVPFNLQNYLYGVTAIRFWPCVLTSWVAMLPGTFLYVYLGSLGKTAATGGATSTAEWVVWGIGLIATIAVTVYIARLARGAMERRTQIEDADERQAGSAGGGREEEIGAAPKREAEGGWPWSTLLAATAAVALMGLALWATVRRDVVRQSVERVLGMPPTVTAVEAYEPRRGGPRFDHLSLTPCCEGTSTRTAGSTTRLATHLNSGRRSQRVISRPFNGWNTTGH